MKWHVVRTGFVSSIGFFEIQFMYIRILKCPVNLCYSECLKRKVLIV